MGQLEHRCKMLDYHMALCYPTDMAEAAKEMDRLLFTMLECSSSQSIPKIDEGRGVECCMQIPVTRHQGRSYQDHMVRLPVRLGGMGLRSMTDVSLVAFLGSVEQALPHFIGEGGFCQQLAPVLGNMRDAGHRWRDIVTSQCRTGAELERAWTILREEATQSCQ